MIRRIIHIVVWLLILSWFLVIMGFISDRNAETLCKMVSIEVSDSSEVEFITSQDIREIIRKTDIDLQGYPVSQINTRMLERSIEKGHYVKNAEVYLTVEGEIILRVDQRKPLVRLMPKGREGYYIDADGQFLPLSESYSPMVLLVTGNLAVPQDIIESGLLNGPDHTTDTKWLYQVLDLAHFIAEHPFWKDQIVQLYRDSKGEFELIPRVGAHQIMMGSLDNYEEKLRKLKLLYEQGFRKYGWNNYNKINLKYTDQVICTKR